MKLDCIFIRRFMMGAMMIVALASCDHHAAPTSKRTEVDNVFKELSAFKGSETRQRGEARLRSLGTNAIPLVLREIENLGVMLQSKDVSQRKAAFERRVALHTAIEMLEPSLLPYGNEFVRQLHSGKNPADAAFVLTKLGDDYGLVIIRAITNASSIIRLAAAGTALEFQGKPFLAANAIDPLITVLTDESPYVRVASAQALGKFSIMPDKCLPALMGRVKNDSDSLVKIVAAGAISRFGTNASGLEIELQNAAEADSNPAVKRAVGKALEAMNRRKNRMKE